MRKNEVVEILREARDLAKEAEATPTAGALSALVEHLHDAWIRVKYWEDWGDD